MLDLGGQEELQDVLEETKGLFRAQQRNHVNDDACGCGMV